MLLSKDDSCRKFVTPKLIELGWEDAPHQIAEQHVFADAELDTLVQSLLDRAFKMGLSARGGKK